MICYMQRSQCVILAQCRPQLKPVTGGPAARLSISQGSASQCHRLQEETAKTQCNPLLHRGSCAVAQPGVLHCAQHLPIEEPLLLLWPCDLLVWLGPLDLLEHSKSCTLVSTLALILYYSSNSIRLLRHRASACPMDTCDLSNSA